MHDVMPYGRNQGQGHSREVDRQSPTGLFFNIYFLNCVFHLRGDFILLSWKEVWSPLLLRNDGARGHVTWFMEM